MEPPPYWNILFNFLPVGLNGSEASWYCPQFETAIGFPTLEDASASAMAVGTFPSMTCFRNSSSAGDLCLFSKIFSSVVNVTSTLLSDCDGFQEGGSGKHSMSRYTGHGSSSGGGCAAVSSMAWVAAYSIFSSLVSLASDLVSCCLARLIFRLKYWRCRLAAHFSCLETMFEGLGSCSST